MDVFWRLLGFLRPYRAGVVTSLALASVAMVGTVAIPALVGRTVDAIQRGDRGAMLPYAAAIVGAGVLRLALSVSRRLIAGRVSLGVEYDLRNRLYGHLQSLELGFFDGQQVGQLMSRATVDLQSVRFFLGYGLVFIVQNLLTILLAAVAMVIVKPTLAAITLAPVPLVILAAARYGRYSRPALQEVQQRIAELTAQAEESISGVRLVKAFAREREQQQRFEHSVARVFDQSMLSTHLRAVYNPMISFLPNLGLATVVFIVFLLIASAAKSIVRGLCVHRGRRQNLTLLLGQLAQTAVIVLGFLVALSRHGATRGRLRKPAVPDSRPRPQGHQPSRSAATTGGWRPGRVQGCDALLQRRPTRA